MAVAIKNLKKALTEIWSFVEVFLVLIYMTHVYFKYFKYIFVFKYKSYLTETNITVSYIYTLFLVLNCNQM